MEKKWIILMVFIISFLSILALLFALRVFPIRGNGFSREFSPGKNFTQLSETQIQELKYFFESNPDADKITSYCEEKRFECFYYCRNINSSSEFCNQMQPPINGQPQKQ